ncbi:MAG: hypothetical protein U5K38_09275 [Woeseiaceae bacterium]|nr:hypothetical protein [Woeseiaceae bacterium]
MRRGVATIAIPFVVALAAAASAFLLWPPAQRDAETGITGIERPIRPNSVAVLPFENVNLNPDDAYVSDGMASTLIDQLSHVDDLNVIARTSSVVFRDRNVDTPTIASRLGVESLVEGSLEREDDIFRVSVAIVDGESGFRTWSEAFEGDRLALPVLQREIAAAIIAQLAPGYEGQAASRGSQQLDPTAYDLMLLARARYEDVRDQPIVDHEKLDEAIRMYRQLTELTPDSAQAWSRLAAALLYKGDTLGAAGPINRAIAIDPDSAEAHYALGLSRWLRYEEGTGEAYDRAVSLKPNYADAQEVLAKYIWHQLVSDVPEQHFLRALEFDAQRLTRYADLATYYGMSGRYAEARGSGTGHRGALRRRGRVDGDRPDARTRWRHRRGDRLGVARPLGRARPRGYSVDGCRTLRPHRRLRDRAPLRPRAGLQPAVLGAPLCRDDRTRRRAYFRPARAGADLVRHGPRIRGHRRLRTGDRLFAPTEHPGTRHQQKPPGQRRGSAGHACRGAESDGRGGTCPRTGRMV